VARDHLTLTDRLKLGGIPALRRLERATPQRLRRLPPSKLLRRAMPTLEGQLHVDLPPERLFRDVSHNSGNLDRILFVVSAAGPETTVEPIDPLEVASRMRASLVHERLDLATLLLQAPFPSLQNDHLANAEARQGELLDRIFAGRPAYLVTHPYPVDLAALLDSVRPVLAPS
jgi:hypothetical protein